MDYDCDWCEFSPKCKRYYERPDCVYKYYQDNNERVANVKLINDLLQKAINELENSNLDDYCCDIRFVINDIKLNFNDELKNEWEELNKK